MEHEVANIIKEIMGYCKDYPGIQIAVVANSGKCMSDNIYSAIAEACRLNSHQFEYDIYRQRIYFANGSRVSLMEISDPEKINGWEGQVCWFIQGSYEGVSAEVVRQIYNACLMRLRSRNPKYDVRWIVS